MDEKIKKYVRKYGQETKQIDKKLEAGFNKIRKDVVTFAADKPVHAAGIAIAGALLLFWVLSSMEILPEFGRFRLPQGTVIEKGDSMNWLGMSVIEVTRSIRNDFKLPKNIRGMFVIDEGRTLAAKYGVKTGDVIVAVSRKNVPSARAFVNAANNAKYYDGILLDINRDGKGMFISIPYEYQYGPLMGPAKGSWQMGSPLIGKAFQYGPVFKGNAANNTQNG
ncbi:MAG: PDZ domain-containing protein [Candidatus Omnitrophica bacterium]|nr:PDZ domain-containing protein [Candidatus Omnitrophota bacterium]